MAKAGTLFEEELQFPRRVIWLVVAALISMVLVLIGIFGVGIYQQLVLGRPWGDRPMTNANLVMFGVGMVAIVILTDVPILWLILRSRQRTRLTGMHLTVDAPLAGRKVTVRDIAHWEIKPSRSCGVSYKFRSGWEINLAGRHCIHVRTRQGRRFAVGTRRPEEFNEALEQATGALGGAAQIPRSK